MVWVYLFGVGVEDKKRVEMLQVRMKNQGDLAPRSYGPVRVTGMFDTTPN